MHVPFCFHKCHYCDFYSFVDSRDRQGVFTDRLIEELSALAEHAGVLRSVFVGGGTPSLLAVEHWERLLAGLWGVFERGADLEFTVECNPETVTGELMDVLAAGGVNRVSVGAQSFDRAHLETLERWHEPLNVRRALEFAREAGIGRRSVDLIYGVPGQSLEEWGADLSIVERFAEEGLVDHASCYALTYEPNTAMTKRLARGEFEATDEDLEVAMYHLTVERLGSVGLGRYEVSNFAVDGSACDHNLGYWRGDDWLAAGPSASGHAGGHRWKNVPRLGDWLEGVAAGAGYSPIVDYEGPDARRALAERLMMGLRLSEGVDRASVVEAAGSFGRGEALERGAWAMADLGRLTDADGRWTLTEEGFLFADGVASALMAALEGDG